MHIWELQGIHLSFTSHSENCYYCREMPSILSWDRRFAAHSDSVTIDRSVLEHCLKMLFLFVCFLPLPHKHNLRAVTSTYSTGYSICFLVILYPLSFSFDLTCPFLHSLVNDSSTWKTLRWNFTSPVKSIPQHSELLKPVFLLSMLNTPLLKYWP